LIQFLGHSFVISCNTWAFHDVVGLTGDGPAPIYDHYQGPP
jgi:hypothetical protein